MILAAAIFDPNNASNLVASIQNDITKVTAIPRTNSTKTRNSNCTAKVPMILKKKSGRRRRRGWFPWS